MSWPYEMIPKQEGTYLANLMQKLSTLSGCIALRHEDVRNGGIPDLSFTRRGRTSWWEFKHATPHFESHGLQIRTCQELAAYGHCHYVIWREGNDYPQQTWIVKPEVVFNHLKNKQPLLPIARITGFDINVLANLIYSYGEYPSSLEALSGAFTNPKT